ncbi:MAG: sigma-70 family RNA polymerase sigma factor [Gemmatales bacterium]
MSVLQDWQKNLGMNISGEADGEYLRQFVQHRDSDAFGKIVRRHAAMVHAVCRRVLENAADAEDASQATFLILAQRASSIRQKIDVGGWLFGVARRVALQALRQRQRQQKRELCYAAQPVKDPAEVLAAREVALFCDEELQKLPQRYRQALVLCCIEGLPKALAAKRLGWPEGTVASSIARGKQLLAKRLIRRGVLPALATAVMTTSVVQAIPASLGNLSSAALAHVTGRSLANLALPGAIQLFYKVQSTMLLQKRLLVLACSACLLLVGPGLLWGWHVLNTPSEVLAESEPVVQQDAAKTDTPATTPKKAETDQERLQGRWKLVAVVSNAPETKNPFSLNAIGSMIEFKDDKFIRVAADGKYDIVPGIVFRMNDRVQPKELDITFSNGITEPGLYALDTDTLLICESDAVNGQRIRPIEISAARNGSTRIAVYRRVPRVGTPSAEELRIAEELAVAKVGRSLRACLIAMHNYHNDNRQLPQSAIFEKSTGKALLSWRVMLLPYLDQGELYQQFKLDEPWDSEHNKKLISKMPAIYAHPGTKAAADFKTHYRVFVAPAKTPEGKKNLFAPIFSLSPTEKPTLEQLTLADGTSNTIAVVESTDAVFWTKPDEILIEHDEAPVPSLGAIPNSPYFVATHFDGANHLYKRVVGNNPVANSWYYRYLRQMIGWKDGFNLDTSSILVR